MINFTYDIPKSKITIKTDNKEIEQDLEKIIRTIAICGTLLIGFNLYLEYKKYVISL